ncbi:polysaccharide deacetylase family protein [Gillisia mitskevichiae]|uniref:polysaccharide deacetylase family protein n=1 Tax=Gillisia mitskevichiae TaxID=270921 RepID=UPI001600DCBD|nr:polysaccharide deacetylase family protein [Gillisia mitskevichiae]
MKEHLFKKKQLPKSSVLITFDDGDFSVLKYGLPILKKNKVPTCLFVITNLINSQKPFWWDEIREYLGNDDGNKKVKEVKSWPNIKRENYLKELRNNSDKPNKIVSQLTFSDLVELKTGGVFIANHSHTHPMLDMSSEYEIQNEFEESKSLFKKWNLNGFDVFAYPNGNFDKNSELLLERNQIKLAFLFDHKINKKNVNPLRISRIRVNSDTVINEFKVKTSGIHSFIASHIRSLN